MAMNLVTDKSLVMRWREDEAGFTLNGASGQKGPGLRRAWRKNAFRASCVSDQCGFTVEVIFVPTGTEGLISQPIQPKVDVEKGVLYGHELGH